MTPYYGIATFSKCNWGRMPVVSLGTKKSQDWLQMILTVYADALSVYSWGGFRHKVHQLDWGMGGNREELLFPELVEATLSFSTTLHSSWVPLLYAYRDEEGGLQG